MTKLVSRLCLAFLASLCLAGSAGAQVPEQSPEQAQRERQAAQPGNNAPVWREVRSGTPNYTSIPGRETSVLIQPTARFPGQEQASSAGEAWRQFRNGPVTFYGGWLLVIVVLAIAAHYFGKGPIKLSERPTGRLMQRFNTLEQVVHWSAAISFVVLATTGLIMLFGKHVLLPVIGYTLFAWLTALGKNLHNFIAPLFIVAVIAMVITWAKDNLPRAYDLAWFRGAWGFLMGRAHPPSGRFNAGEKVWFWGGVLGIGMVMAVTGMILLFPNFDQTRATMQDAWVVHAISALIFMCMALGHIYVGTIGIEGSYQSMRTGYVDEIWAKDHHPIWYDEQKRSGRGPASAGGGVPAGALHMRKQREE